MERDNRANRNTPETRERAVGMTFDNLGNYPDRSTAIRAIAPALGCSGESLRRWVSQAEMDGGVRECATSEERSRIKELEREVRDLRQANEIQSEEEQENVRGRFYRRTPAPIFSQAKLGRPRKR